MTTISTDNARGGTASPSHRVLKVLLFSLGITVLAGLAFIAFA